MIIWKRIKAFIKHTLLLVAALSFFSCRKDAPAGKWVVAEYTYKSDIADQRFTYQYDNQGRLVRVTEDMKGVLTVHLVYTYDQNTITRYTVDNPVDLENWTSKVVYTLDNSGRVIKSVNVGMDETSIYSYSPDGFLDTVTDEEGDVSIYSWKNNSLEKIMRPDGITVRYTYTDKESLGLFTVNYSERGDNNLTHLGCFGKNSRLLPAKIEDVTSDGKVVMSTEYNYTSFDATAHLTGYTETTSLSMAPLETKSTNTCTLTWKNLQ